MDGSLNGFRHSPGRPVRASFGARAVSALAALVLSQAVSLAAQAPDAKAIALIADVESKLNVEALDLTSTFTLVQKKAGEADRVLRLRIFRRDSANRFAIVFQFPDSEKGKGYYRNGDDLYLYLPTTREFVYRNRKDDVGSTDVRTDLFGRLNLNNQYVPTVVGREKVAKFDTTVIRLDAKALDVSFPLQRWFLRDGDNLPVKVENYSAGGALLRTFFYVDYKEVARGKYLNTKLLAVNNLEKDQKTLLTNENVSTARIPDYTFSQAFLEEQSR